MSGSLASSEKPNTKWPVPFLGYDGDVRNLRAAAALMNMHDPEKVLIFLSPKPSTFSDKWNKLRVDWAIWKAGGLEQYLQTRTSGPDLEKNMYHILHRMAEERGAKIQYIKQYSDLEIRNVNICTQAFQCNINGVRPIFFLPKQDFIQSKENLENYCGEMRRFELTIRGQLLPVSASRPDDRAENYWSATKNAASPPQLKHLTQRASRTTKSMA